MAIERKIIAENQNTVISVFTVKEVAHLLRTNPTYVYKLINSGNLKAIKLGTYKITSVELNTFLTNMAGYDLTNPYNIYKKVATEEHAR